MLAWNNMSWGYWQYQPVPVVSRYKWVEPRHMINVCERWAKDRTDGMQSAFFNGTGYESWRTSGASGTSLRRAMPPPSPDCDYRASHRRPAHQPGWQPHVATVQKGVYASRFPARAARCACSSIERPRTSPVSNSTFRIKPAHATMTCGRGRS